MFGREEAGGYSLDGSSLVLGVWDQYAVRTTHREFKISGVSRVVQKDGATNLGDGHSTAVAGAMIAAGKLATVKSPAFNAQLDAYDTGLQNLEIADAALAGMRVSNHSYGGATTGWERSGGNWFWHGWLSMSTNDHFAFGYSGGQVVVLDGISYDEPYYLSVWAPGNERGLIDQGPPSEPIFHTIISGFSSIYTNLVHGPDGKPGGYETIVFPSTAKNCISVGNVEALPGGYAGPSSVVLNSGSSIGPTDDGRIKPDLVANGVDVPTCSKDGDAVYTTAGGTSFSAPSVAGSLGLLIEHYETENGGCTLLSSTLKGLAIHTADEAGPSAGPDYKHGWGLMSTRKAADLIADDAGAAASDYMKEIILLDGDYIEFPIEALGTEPLKVTACWTDVAWAGLSSLRLTLQD